MTKKCIAMLLVLSICLSLSSVSLAIDEPEQGKETVYSTEESVNAIDSPKGVDVEKEVVQMESVGHGEFILSNSKTNTTKAVVNTADSAQKGEIVFVIPTKDDDIFQTSERKYLVRATKNSYLLTDKIAVNIDAFEKTATSLEN